jgi:uncharacterized protein YggE
MLKKIILVASLLLPLAASATDLPEYPFIHVGGSGFSYVMPDVGEIDFEISASHSDPEAARQMVEGRIAEIRALVAQLALADADVEIRDLRKEMRKPDPAQPGVVQYDIKCGVHIKVSDLSKWRELVGPLIAMPNLDAFMSGFDTSKREQLETDLTSEAIKAARRKAEAIAAGFGRKLGPVNGVSAGDLKNLSRAMGFAGAETIRARNVVARNDRERDALLMIEVMKMSRSVDVIFRIR